MACRNDRQVANVNRRVSNIVARRGRTENIGSLLCQGGHMSNFVISGGMYPEDRYDPMFDVLDEIIGNGPVIILHNYDGYMENMAIDSWKRIRSTVPLWVLNDKNMEFEPFYGMNNMQVVETLRNLAVKLEYTVTPRFERVVQAHLSILKLLKIPISLTGLHYLCQFYDIGEFHDNIMELPCEEREARRIWADLGVDSEEENNQFDLFRSVVNNFANEAQQSAWNPDDAISACNCVKAFQQNATILLSIDNMYTKLLIPYLLEELKTNRQSPFMLILDGVKITDKQFSEYLRNPGTGCSCGIVTENLVEMLGRDIDSILGIAERMDYIVLFKHATGGTASVLSDILGKYEHTKMEIGQGTNQGYFRFFPRDRHDDVRYSTENRYRVMPENIMSLQAGQAIIFNTKTDQIIYLN